jgi:hypothetical protein
MNEPWMFMILVIPIVAIVGGLINASLALHHRARIKELALRERIAMIERGMKPPPEVDPATFAREWDEPATSQPAGSTAARHRTAGVILMGVGLGVALLIVLSGARSVGIGVGGAIVILGVAFLVNSVLTAKLDRPASRLPLESRVESSSRTGAGDPGAPDLP